MKLVQRILTLFIVVSVAGAINARAATVDTALVHSTAMNKDIKTVVVKPADYTAATKFPVLYLLHGFSGSYADWITKVPAIKNISDQYHMIIVCPDGGFASWYFDSPVSKEWQFETYVAKEVVNYTDSHYSTIQNRSGRAITGLSMGGHGAFYLAIKHPDIFGAIGSMSGGLDLRPFPDAFGISQVLGKETQFPDRWAAYSVTNMVDQLKPNSFAITFDCGYDDFFYKINLALHNKLLDKKIPHDFTIRPGSHSWEYWGNSIQYQALFFSNFFKLH